MNRRFLLAAALVGAVAIAALAVRAGAQAPVPVPPQSQPPATVFVKGPDGTITETTLDGKIVRTTSAGVPPSVSFQPRTTADGRTVYYAVAGQGVQDAETTKLAAQEQSAAQEARALAGQYAQADSDAAREEVKKKLREKLATIFDLQQQRRDREVAQIEERLGKLKETMKKRDTSKDPIIDRRLDQLTGGVDELGWEEPGAYPNTPYGYGVFNPSSQDPNAARYSLPATTPAPAKELPAPVPVPAPANR